MDDTYIKLDENADVFEIAAIVACIFMAYSLDETDIEEVCAIAFDLADDMRSDLTTLH